MLYRSPVIKNQYLPDDEVPKTAKVIRYFDDDSKVILEDHEEESGEDKKFEKPADSKQVDAEVLARIEEVRAETERFVEKARTEVEEILTRANEEAAGIVDQAREKEKSISEQAVNGREKAFSKAHDEGFAKGYQEGVAKGLDETRSLVMGVGAIMGEIKAHKRDAMKIAESQILQLSMAIAARVVRHETRMNAGVVVNTVREALKAVDDKENLKIMVNPEDLEVVTTHREDFMEIVRGVKELQIVSDTSLSNGGCVIQTNLGNIDAQVETALGIIDNEFKRVFSSREE